MPSWIAPWQMFTRMRTFRFFLAGIVLSCCAVASAAATPTGRQHAGDIERVIQLPDGVELVCDAARVRVTAYHDGVIRVRLAPSGVFVKDFSWAVVEPPAPPAWKLEDSATSLHEHPHRFPGWPP